jgi:tRNA pseudouridine38-40 synthase
MRNIKLKIAYDGSAYCGWQKTQIGPSIEGTIESVLSRILQHPIKLQAASRTDAGVHAFGQIINFFTDREITLDKLKYSLNCLLPRDIAVNGMEIAADDFHPTLDCKGKEYHYHVCYHKIQLPHERHYVWHYPYAVDLQKIRDTIPLLIGQKDFSSFCNARLIDPYPHYIRNLEAIELEEYSEGFMRFKIYGNNFLYKMVRNLVGTLVYVGVGKIKCEEISDILLAKDRTKAGLTAPAHGLCLFEVKY